MPVRRRETVEQLDLFGSVAEVPKTAEADRHPLWQEGKKPHRRANRANGT
jgi:hypothetical protein